MEANTIDGPEESGGRSSQEKGSGLRRGVDDSWDEMNSG